jgi:hypothetical protein
MEAQAEKENVIVGCTVGVSDGHENSSVKQNAMSCSTSPTVMDRHTFVAVITEPMGCLLSEIIGMEIHCGLNAHLLFIVSNQS